MERKNKKYIYISIMVIAVSVLLIFATFGLSAKEYKEKDSHWVLQSYGNNVALFNGEEIVEVYGSIVLDTLPEEDIRLLNNGISFLTKEEAVMAIEDYDG